MLQNVSKGMRQNLNLPVHYKNVPVRLLRTRFKAINFIGEPGPQEPYRDFTETIQYCTIQFQIIVRICKQKTITWYHSHKMHLFLPTASQGALHSLRITDHFKVQNQFIPTNPTQKIPHILWILVFLSF
jgi:hypothetical protein